MKKILIVSAVIVIAIIGMYTALRSEYNRKMEMLQSGGEIGYGASWLESALENFYRNRGEFPERVLFDGESDWKCDSAYRARNTAVFHRPFIDEFTSNDDNPESIVYYPVYNRKNGRRESFVLLSAGIDGKLNNQTPDTLYMDTWWRQLDIYNFQEVMATVFCRQAFGQLSLRTTISGGMIGIGDNYYAEISKCQQSYCPDFSIFQYFFGKKDYVVRFGLPYYIYAPTVNAEIDAADFDKEITWTLTPELIWRDSIVF